MTQEANIYQIPSGAEGVAQCVERLIVETNEDLKIFRNEQSQLRAQLSSVLDENRFLTTELDKFKQVMNSGGNDDMQNRLQVTNEALSKAMSTIDSLKKERRTLQSMQECSRRTIQNMEIELKSYRTELPLENQSHIMQKYKKHIKKLETKICKQQDEIRAQANVVKALHEHKQRCGDQIEHLQSKLSERELDSTLQEDTNNKIRGLKNQLKEMEKSLLHVRTKLEESTKREVVSMQKVQDAIALSEAAVREKMEAEKRAESYKEETTNLATTIGNVMNDAAKQADNELKAKLAEKDKTISLLHEKKKTEIMEYKNKIQLLETRNTRITQKYKEALKQNENLETHIGKYNKRLNELETCALKEEANILKSKKNHEAKMENYVHAYKDLKAHFKEVLNDLTKKYEIQIDNLHKEKCDLEVENGILKGSAAGDCIGKLIYP